VEAPGQLPSSRPVRYGPSEAWSSFASLSHARAAIIDTKPQPIATRTRLVTRGSSAAAEGPRDALCFAVSALDRHGQPGGRQLRLTSSPTLHGTPCRERFVTVPPTTHDCWGKK